MPGIVNAGSIVQSWIHDPDYQRLRDLYPVKFYEDFEIFDDWGQQTSSVRGLEFTRDGIDAGFLQLDDNPLASQRVWTEFEGVYGPRPVKGKKLGATVYARYEDDLAESIGQKPIFFAGQFYGKGRVFYQASGEMWRLRRLDAAYFEKWYTHLIRHVSTGRLHRGSARGVVLERLPRSLNLAGEAIHRPFFIRAIVGEPVDQRVGVIAYSPLARGLDVLKAHLASGVLEDIAAATGRTEGKVALNWIISKDGAVAIPKDDTAAIVKENCAASGWRLSPGHIERLEQARTDRSA